MEPYQEAIDYYYGCNGHEKNVELAIEMLHVEAEHRNPQALYFLGTMHRYLAKCSPNAASKHNAQAYQYYLPLAFIWQVDKTEKIDKEMQFDVLCFLGLTLEDINFRNFHVDQNDEEEDDEDAHEDFEDVISYAVFYEQAAKLGYQLPSRVKFIMAEHYYANEQYESAYKLLAQLVNDKYEKSAQCLRYLGQMYEHGRYLQCDYSKAIDCYIHVCKLAKNQTSELKIAGIQIYYHIARLMVNGGPGLNPNIDKALKYLELAIEIEPENLELKTMQQHYTLPVVKTLHSYPESIVNKIMALNHPPMFTCPISCDLMMDPVVVDDGLSYERSEIEKYFASKGAKPNRILETNSIFKIRPIYSNRVMPNTILAQLIMEYIASEAKKIIAAEKKTEIQTKIQPELKPKVSIDLII